MHSILLYLLSASGWLHFCVFCILMCMHTVPVWFFRDWYFFFYSIFHYPYTTFSNTIHECALHMPSSMHRHTFTHSHTHTHTHTHTKWTTSTFQEEMGYLHALSRVVGYKQSSHHQCIHLERLKPVPTFHVESTLTSHSFHYIISYTCCACMM